MLDKTEMPCVKPMEEATDMRQTASQDVQDCPRAIDKLMGERAACEAAWRAIETCAGGLVPDKTLAQQIEILHERNKAEIGKLRQVLRVAHEYIKCIHSECRNELVRGTQEGLMPNGPHAHLWTEMRDLAKIILDCGVYIPESPSDPIRCWDLMPTFEDRDLIGWDGPGWYFWNETWTDLHGPFATLEETRTALRTYGKQL